MSTYFEKSQHPDRKGEGGVNPYGQPDSKKTVFFDDFPKYSDHFKPLSTIGIFCICEFKNYVTRFHEQNNSTWSVFSPWKS